MVLWHEHGHQSHTLTHNLVSGDLEPERGTGFRSRCLCDLSPHSVVILVIFLRFGSIQDYGALSRFINYTLLHHSTVKIYNLLDHKVLNVIDLFFLITGLY